jgi:glycerophosphoryl diester phosphodiesterase
MMNLNFGRVLVYSLVIILRTGISQDAAQISADFRPIIIAHRGNHIKLPENSLAAIKSAIAIGADYVEVDLRSTKDHKLILLHDAKVNRMTDGQGFVRDLSLNQIHKLRLRGSPDSAAMVIPTFKQVLNYCKGKIKIYLDFKQADINQTIQEINDSEMGNDIVVYLYNQDQIKIWKSLAPEIPVIQSMPENDTSLKQLENFVKNKSVDILDGHWRNYTLEMIEYCKQQGVPIWADIQSPRENKKYWTKILSLGFDGIQTDHPEALLRFLNEDNKLKKRPESIRANLQPKN